MLLLLMILRPLIGILIGESPSDDPEPVADSEGGKGEIRFRGIPWGCSPYVFEENMGISFGKPILNHLDLWSKWNKPYLSASDITKYEAGYAYWNKDVV